MKIVKVIKEMPFCKVGEELELTSQGGLTLWNNSSCECNKPHFYSHDVQGLIETGWLAPVPEKRTLEEKIVDTIDRMFVPHDIKSRFILQTPALKTIALLARQHYKEQFEEWIREWYTANETKTNLENFLRSKLKKA